MLGGLIAGALYYFHYVPGVLRGAAAVEAEADLFAARTFFMFRNEAKQSLRVWRLGFWLWVLAGLVAAPFAVKRARAEARPVLVAWLLAWALLMLFKDPVFLPAPAALGQGGPVPLAAPLPADRGRGLVAAAALDVVGRRRGRRWPPPPGSTGTTSSCTRTRCCSKGDRP